jgi:hypothetical protein
MRVAGVEVPDVAVAELALLLYEAGKNDIAWRIGNAVETKQPELSLNRADVLLALSVLDDCAEELAPLRGALLAHLAPTPPNGNAPVD